jgi:O-6-methylguanine DNA methyltransferase
MTHQNDLAAARQLVHDLRACGQMPAPETLLAGVLAQLGLGDAYTILETPIGALFVAFNDLGISAVMRAEDAVICEQTFRVRFGRPIHPASTPPEAIKAAIEAEFAGGERPDLRFDLRGLSPFEQAVLTKALEIPRGEVRPYAWIAREIGRPGAVRAVGNALNGNPVPLLIPCHRVVQTSGQIGNYVFGSQTKRAVLAAEGAGPEVLENLARAGVRFFGDPRDQMFCLPTCGGMHLRNDPVLIPLRSERDARAAGFAPCDACRPAAVG